jgi:hypothetical protein
MVGHSILGFSGDISRIAGQTAKHRSKHVVGLQKIRAKDR